VELRTFNNTSGLADTDNDPKIQVEESYDEDIIRFDQTSTGFFRRDSGRLVSILNILIQNPKPRIRFLDFRFFYYICQATVLLPVVSHPFLLLFIKKQPS